MANKRQFLSIRQKIYLPFKRFFDILLSLLTIIVFSPLYIILTILVKCSSKGPVFFKQERIGKYKKHFKILKFRTMRIDTPKDVPTHLLENPEIYITGIGRFLRKTSLDEIPQAFNIFAGQMSIVGPRPALYNQDDLVAERDKYHANDIVPGLSGWAQCNGRDTLPIPEKAKLDGEYVKRFNIWFDIRIIFRTFFQAFRGKDEVEGKSNNSN
jgi:O-antigen biosynthesis protein WbqP